MKLSKVMLFPLFLGFSTAIFAAIPQGCNFLIGTWQGNGTVNGKPQPITLQITGMKNYQNWKTGSSYTVSGFLNNIPLTAQNLDSFCSESLTTEGRSVELFEFGTNTGLYGWGGPAGSNTIKPTKLNINGAATVIVPDLEKIN